MLVAAVLLFLIIDHFGKLLVAPAAANAGEFALTAERTSGLQAPPVKPARHDALAQVLVAMTAIIVAGRLLSRLFRRFGQPPVVGEVLAGIMLGPSLLGRVSPEAMNLLLPAAAAPYLAVVAQLGVILYMFLVGLELNWELLRRRAGAAVAISHASIVVPFLLGAGLALVIYPRLSHADVKFTSFALFLGVAMAITAFPVLARILTDRRMTTSDLGVMAMSCAATDDVTAWCLLALVVGVAQAHLGWVIVVIALTVLYIVLMFLVVRPLAASLVRRYETTGLTPQATGNLFVAVLLSALATEWIGIHAIFGAFLLGVVVPHDSRVARELAHKLTDLVTMLLLPAFFAYTGMRTRIDLVTGLESWLICGLIIVVATLGKFGGTLVAARLKGLGWRDSAALGTLMNTRGLMELVVLNIALDLGIVSPALFAMMVLMALATTVATSPVLSWLVPWRGESPHETPTTAPLLRLETLLSKIDDRMVHPSSRIHENGDELVIQATARILAENQRIQADLTAAQLEIDSQKRQAESLAAEARTDMLTKLPNRRCFTQDLARRFDQWQRQQVPLSLMMLDIDHFKHFNDTWGHQAGDAVLKELAVVLADTVRQMDMPARYGGEEFAVILPSTDMAGAIKAAERLRATIAWHTFVYGADELRVTASVGVATLSKNETIEELVGRADLALYAAKQGGRDCAYWHDGDDCRAIEPDLGIVRSPFRRILLIAPYGAEGTLPTASSFREVLCYDLSAQGISFLFDEVPDFENLVLWLGQPPDERILVCRVANVTALAAGEAAKYRVGCSFVDPLDGTSELLLSMAELLP